MFSSNGVTLEIYLQTSFYGKQRYALGPYFIFEKARGGNSTATIDDNDDIGSDKWHGYMVIQMTTGAHNLCC